MKQQQQLAIGSVFLLIVGVLVYIFFFKNKCKDDKPYYNKTTKKCEVCPSTTPKWNKTKKECEACPSGKPNWNSSTKLCEEIKEYMKEYKETDGFGLYGNEIGGPLPTSDIENNKLLCLEDDTCKTMICRTDDSNVCKLYNKEATPENVLVEGKEAFTYYVKTQN